MTFTTQDGREPCAAKEMTMRDDEETTEEALNVNELQELAVRLFETRESPPWNERDKAITADLTLQDVRLRLVTMTNIEERRLFIRSLVDFLFTESVSWQEQLLRSNVMSNGFFLVE